jgi:hypothetical protein
MFGYVVQTWGARDSDLKLVNHFLLLFPYMFLIWSWYISVSGLNTSVSVGMMSLNPLISGSNDMCPSRFAYPVQST